MTKTIRPLLLCLFALLVLATHSPAQTGLVNGSIQGIITDASGARVPAARVRAVNTATQFVREVFSAETGQYELALLPLGGYEVTVTASGFGAWTQGPVTVQAGKSTLLNVELRVASSQETVNVTADASILALEPAVQGGLNTRAVLNMPSVARNVQNLALFAPGVIGRRDDEFGTTQFAFGGMPRRGFTVDGLDNTQRGGQLRLGVFSTESIGEINVVQNAMSAEYGRTVGGIVNMVTRGGANQVHGDFLWLVRRPGLIARPSLAATDPFQQRAVYAGTLSGPIVKDKLFFFVNAEYHPLDQPRPITITPANAAALSIPESELGAAPFAQRFQMYLGRLDYRVNDRNFGFVRYNYFFTPSKFNTSGGLLVKSAGNNFDDRQDSTAAQWTTMASPAIVNEFRFGDLRREFFRPPVSGVIGPVTQITGVANLGSNGSAAQRYNEVQNQFIDNLSIRLGAHTLKLGLDFSTTLVDQFDRLSMTYTFGGLPGVTPLNQYLNTINKVQNPATGRPFTYTQLTQSFGNNTARTRTQAFNYFIQDDWRVSRKVTLNFGIRYELVDYPFLSPTGQVAGSMAVPNDTNNFAPRFGFALTPMKKTVVRGGYGLFYDTTNLRLLSAVVRGDGVRVTTYRINGADPASPPYPTGLTSPNPSFGVKPSVTVFAQDFRSMYAHQANLQIEQEIVADLSVTAGWLFYGSHRAPLTIDTNTGAPTGALADGRPVYGGVRPDTRFNQVFELRSVANSNSHAGFLSVNKRYSRGLQFGLHYMLSHSINDNDSSGDSGSPVTDPSNIRWDRGSASADQRHRFTLAAVWEPRIAGNRTAEAIVNGWMFAPNYTYGSGFPVNLVQGSDLNRDSNNNDRPLFTPRNSLTGPSFSELNLRLSRSFPLYKERVRLDFIAEAENLLNSTNPACGVGGCTGAVVNRYDAADLLRPTSALNSRQIQLGARIRF